MIRPDVVLVLLLASAAPAEAHDWYSGLRNGDGTPCCDAQDCRPVGLCVRPDGTKGLVIEGACRPIPRDKVQGVREARPGPVSRARTASCRAARTAPRRGPWPPA